MVALVGRTVFALSECLLDGRLSWLYCLCLSEYVSFDGHLCWLYSLLDGRLVGPTVVA